MRHNTGEPTAGSVPNGGSQNSPSSGISAIVINPMSSGQLTPQGLQYGVFALNPGSLPRSLSYAMGRRSSNMSPGEFCTLNTLEMEAIAAVHELRMFVKDAYVSDLLPRTSELVFINVTSLEGQAFCIELTNKGWRVTSLRHDCMNGDFSHIDLHTRYFETIYSLMDVISPAYRHGFTELLAWRLKTLDGNKTARPGGRTDDDAGSDPGESEDAAPMEWRYGLRVSASTPVTPCSTPLRSQAREAMLNNNQLTTTTDVGPRKHSHSVSTKSTIPAVAEEDAVEVQKS